MTVGLILPTACIFVSVLVNIIYFSKQRINNYENKIYRYILVINLVSLFWEYLCTYFTYNYVPVLSVTIIKLYLLILLIYMTCLSLYIAVITKEKEVLQNKWKKIKNVYILFFIIFAVFVILGNIQFKTTKLGATVSGSSVIVLYIQSIFCPILWFRNIFFNKQKKDTKKLLPFYIYITLSLLVAIIQYFNPGLLLITPMETFVTLLMYFTIENPDIKMIEQLNIAREAAEKANHAKSDFLSSMSHEIRTPLNAIVGLSEDIKDHQNLPKDIEEEANDIVSASHTLLEIVGNILDINKIESNKMEVNEVPYHFKEEIMELAKITGTRIGEKPIDYNIHIAEDVPYELVGDRIHVKQIVNNLLTNAIKYTDKGSVTLNVRCINQGNQCLLVITCQDTGKGIKAENITKLFNKFERLGVEKSTTVEGTGLGLAITKKLVELMGGTINVQSQYGKGSIFMVQLPQKISQLVNPTPPKEEHQEEVEVLESTNTYQGKRVLIVDDNKLNIKVAKIALKDFDFALDECYSGKEVLEKIAQGEKYDLILMDIMMPEMSGESTMQELKKFVGFDTPVIALTADALTGAKERYLQAGFKDYVSKPFTKEIIKEKIDAILAHKENQ